MAGRVELSPSTWRQPWPTAIDPERAVVIGDIADRVQALGGGRLRVAVDGRTAAGKTTLAHELALRLSDAGRVVLRASLDDFKRPWADAQRYDRETGPGYYRNAFDLQAIHDLLLAPARPTGTGLVALCSIDPLTQIDHSATRFTMPTDGILVVDGVFAFRPELDAHWDLRIWIDIDADLSLRRSVRRDATRAAHATRDGAARAAALHRHRYGPAEDLYIAEAHPIDRADIVVDNTDLDRPRITRR